MFINDTMKTNLTKYRKAYDYWTSKERADVKRHMLITNSLLSLFPLISLFLIASIGIVHTRHQKSRIYLYMFLSVTLFYGLTLGTQKVLIYYTVPIIMFAWLLGTYLLYRNTIVKRF